MSRPTLNAKFEDELGPRIWVDPKADNERWNNLVRKVLADARVKRHMVDVTAIASWSVWPDGSIELHVLLELHIARACIEVRQALQSMYVRWLLAAGKMPEHPYVLDAHPHQVQGVIVTVQHNHNHGSGTFYAVGQDTSFTIKNKSTQTTGARSQTTLDRINPTVTLLASLLAIVAAAVTVLLAFVP